MTTKLALVLAGGGIAGIAWETGFLFGVQEESPTAAARLLGADLLLGTSAGATVAAQVSSAVRLADLYERQLAAPTDEINPQIEIDDLLTLFDDVARQTNASKTQKLQRIGQRALSAPTMSEEVRREVIAKRLPSHDWPDRRLALTAIDADSGEVVHFDRHSGAGLVDAVAASCAVPAVWPPVTIGNRRFMDGGVASTANLDLARDCETVVMLAPTAPPGLSAFGPNLTDELDALPGRAFGVFADDASLRAFGRNPLDPACRAPSARAGRDQGRRQADELAKFLDV
jgi:NTE family protein